MNDELYHYGVLGMKWGVRRTPAELGHKPKKTKKKSGGLFTKKKSKKTKVRKAASKKSSVVEEKKDSISSLSNEELRARIERADLERRYRDLQPKKITKGEAFTRYAMDKIVVPAATDASKTLVKDFLIKQGRAYLGMNNNNNNNGNNNNNRNNQNGNQS